MNDSLQAFARQQLKDGLARLPSAWQDRFKLMYGVPDNQRGPVDADGVDSPGWPGDSDRGHWPAARRVMTRSLVLDVDTIVGRALFEGLC